MDFDTYFRRATGHAPFPYQRTLALCPALPQLLEAPTGAGKTAAAVLGWLWRRRFSSLDIRDETQRRLVFCLPMRSLVDQTATAVKDWLRALDLDEEVGVHALLGGAVDQSWEEYPEADAVLVGTQDQLLSRALNRGYSMSRYRWPVHFGLLNSDTLWVLDEVQLMGVGLSTSAQLQAWRQRWRTFGTTDSLWMSATLDPAGLDTVDLEAMALRRQALGRDDLEHPHLSRRLSAAKPSECAAVQWSGRLPAYATDVAVLVAGLHRPGTLTLVVVNRVERAQAIYRALAKQVEPVRLLHSRFRSGDRAVIQQEVLSDGWEGVLVSTQAVEAGVDLSAATLVTELAPWSSLVQRFGRCNRRGELAADQVAVRWIDLPDAESLPYLPHELAHARARLRDLDDVGISELSKLPDQPGEPVLPVVRSRDLRDLFDTTADLGGSDIDISVYVRDGTSADVQLAWRELDGVPDEQAPRLHRDELCAVSIGQARSFLGKQREAWTWDGLVGRWATVDARRLVPGSLVLLATSAGGYSEMLGWTGSKRDHPAEVQVSGAAPASDSSDLRTWGCREYTTIAEHASEAVRELEELLEALHLELPVTELVEAARWHDLGKSHPCFQKMLISGLPEDDPRRQGGPWAKSDGRRGERNERPHFRHELASALALLAQGGSELSAYLVAAHHGKVRGVLRSRPGEQRPDEPGRRFALGIWDGDELPATDLGGGVHSAGQVLDLEPMELGFDRNGNPSWSSRVQGLLEHWGPYRLAYLEALLRVSDWRGSTHYGEGGSDD